MKKALIHSLIPVAILLAGAANYLIAEYLFSEFDTSAPHELRAVALEHETRSKDEVLLGVLDAQVSFADGVEHTHGAISNFILSTTIGLFILSVVRESYAARSSG